MTHIETAFVYSFCFITIIYILPCITDDSIKKMIFLAQVFSRGWLQGDNVLGRQMNLDIMQDGSLLVSDDYSGKICRITDN
jgi:Ni,Fe-hydrogenase I cytochrome b subunit